MKPGITVQVFYDADFIESVSKDLQKAILAYAHLENVEQRFSAYAASAIKLNSLAQKGPATDPVSILAELFHHANQCIPDGDELKNKQDKLLACFKYIDALRGSGQLTQVNLCVHGPESPEALRPAADEIPY